LYIQSFSLLGLRRLHLNEFVTGTPLDGKPITEYQTSNINIFVGPNGGGKSTVLDMVRALKDFEMLKFLSRENTRHTTISRSVIKFHDFTTVMDFKSQGDNDFILTFRADTENEIVLFRDNILRTQPTAPSDLNAVMQSIPAKISWRTSHDETDVPLEDFVNILNKDASHLTGLASFPTQPGQTLYMQRNEQRIDKRAIRVRGDDALSIDLNDDEMGNDIPVKMLPSGWRAFAGLLAWLSDRKDEICLIEEPETHLHPTLQRLLIQRMAEIAQSNRLQLFISTHSSVLIDVATWPDEKPRLFEANGFALTELTDPAIALAGLGIKPSDIFQANGIVWIEGASDRLYLLHWLQLWCKKSGQKMPVENLHFSFAFYGGSMLSHYSAGRTPGLIDMFSINNNSIVIMDRDLDFAREKGTDRCINENCTKYQVWSDFQKKQNPYSYCWVTEKYTIESYLPSAFREKYFNYKSGRLDKTSSYSKVSLAQKFADKHTTFNSSFENNSDLPQCIEKLFNTISKWNT